nr:hypothetical protein [uncultured Mucilaginibacter sp.]
MKNAIKLSALLLLVSSSIFAATTKAATTKDDISVQSSAKPLVVGIAIQKEATSKSYVTFYDNANNEIMTDYLSGKQSVEKNYNLSQLDLGTYTMAVTSNNQVVKKQIQVYEEFGEKTFVILQ